MRLAKAKSGFAGSWRKQQGFSVLEMLLASAILMVGIVSVVQLVPASLNSSIGNRLDTLATVVCQRELDQMLSQPLNQDTFVDQDGQTISLGGPGAPGAATQMQGDYAEIHFTSFQPPAGYYTFYQDPNDATAPKFELRWAVFKSPPNGNGPVMSKRIIIACRRVPGSATGEQFLLPVNLDSSVQK
jgi:type II secretory pathway pseudopilin PulG